MPRVDSLPSYCNKLDLVLLQDEVAAVRISTFIADDGQVVHLYTMGSPSAEKLILLPPYGMTFLLMSKLARVLARRFHVLIWESAGCPNREESMSAEVATLARQAADFRDIIRECGFEQFHFVGWCQASQLVAYAIATTDVRPKSISWVAPAGLGYSLVKSEFERCVLPIYLEIASLGLAYAEKLAMILDKYRDQPLSAGNAAEKLTMLHLTDPASTHRFSRYMKSYVDNQSLVKGLLDDVLGRYRALIIHCKDDTYSHFSESVQLAERYATVRLELLAQGGHLQLFDSPGTVAELILKHIDDEFARPVDIETHSRIAG